MSRIFGASFAFCVLTSLAQVQAGRIYFTDPGFGDQVSRIRTDGTDLDPIVTFPTIADPRALAIDRANGRAFFSSGSTLQRINLDGTGLTSLGPAGGSVPTEIVLDMSAENMYWSVEGPAGIKRATLDGVGATTLVSQGILDALVGADPLVRADDVHSIALDRVGGRIYWSNGRHLNSMPAGGVSGPADAVHHFELAGAGEINKIKLDLESSEVFWTNSTGSLVQKSSLSGGDQTTLVSRGFGRPAGLAIDFNAGQLYFGDTLGNNGRGQILSADIEGGEAVLVYDSFSTLFAPADLEFGPGSVFPGDTNDDQRVDIVDLNHVRNNFGRIGDGIAGDVNDDQQVGIDDLNSVRNNFGAGSITPVPEPASIALTIVSLTASFCVARRRRYTLAGEPPVAPPC